jgi:O-succinylbenzoate synthase
VTTDPGGHLPSVDDRPVVRAAVLLVAGELRSGHHAAHGSTTERPTVLVEVETHDGAIGWGECPALPRPGYTGEYATAAFALLRDHLLPALVAGHPVRAPGHPMAVGAVADARLDAALRSEGRSLVEALGVTRPAVVGRAIVTRPDDDAGAEALVEAVGRRVDEGYRHVGIKVHPRWLEEPLTALRATFPDLGISIDANGSLARLDDHRWRDLDRFHLDEVEQPCRAGDWMGSARVAGCVGAPVSLDEGITSWHDVRTAVVLGAGRVVNVKPARCGGVAQALRVVRYASDAGLGVLVGGMLESGVGRSAALGLAGLDRCDRPTHLGPSDAYWDEDVTEPVRSVGPGLIEVPRGRGLGRVPRPDQLAARTVERAELGADRP